MLHKEQRVEYRDQNGNILDPEQVKALEGKVEFRTRYETHTRVIDAEGNEVPVPEGWEVPVDAVVAPPHPDVQGVDQETKRAAGEEAAVPEAKQSSDGVKEAEERSPKPASEGNEATAQ